MGSRIRTVAKILLAVGVLGWISQSHAKSPAEPTWNALRALPDSDIVEMQPKSESARFWLLRTYAQLDTSISEAERTLTLATKLAEAGSDEAVLALGLKCTIASVLYEKAAANSACEALSEKLSSISHPLPAAIAQSQWANHLSRAGRFGEAQKVNLEADRLASLVGDQRLVATIRNNQGVDYLVRGFSRQALAQFTSAKEVAADIEDPSITHLLTVNTASALVQQHRYREALDLIQAAMQSPDYDHAAWANFIDHVILARAYLGLDQPQRALDILLPAFERAKSLHWGENHALALATIGQAKYALGNPTDGAQAFNQALELQQQYADRTRYLETGVRHAAALRAHGELAQANVLLQQLITELETMAPSLVLVDALNERALIKAELNDRSGAAVDHDRADQLNTEIHGSEFDQQLALLRSSLALDAKEHQLSHIQQDAEALRLAAESTGQQQRFIVACALLLGLIGYLFFSRHMQKRLAESHKQHNERLEAEVAQRTASLEQEMAERLAIEEKQRLLEEDLAESEKLRAIGQLTSGVAHDFNNLMTVMTLSAEQIQFDDSAAGAEQKKHVEDILNAAASAANITSSLLSFARKQPLQSERINLAQFVDQLLPLFKRTLGEGIEVITAVASCSVLADRSTLTTAFINLLVNAKEAMESRGRVTITVREVNKDETLSDSRTAVEICIADNGPGMTSTEVARAIEPFYTTKSLGRGTGLGLSMVYGFAKQSGGDLRIESTVGEGTRICLTLPRCEEPAQQSAIIDTAAKQAAPLVGRVLVVEDQAQVRQVLCGLLEHLGMVPDYASNGDDAITRLNTMQPPDLLISDVMMPGSTSGQELFNYARQRFPKLPIVLISGYTDTVTADAQLLQKPFSLAELRNSIIQAMRTSKGVLTNPA